MLVVPALGVGLEPGLFPWLPSHFLSQLFCEIKLWAVAWGQGVDYCPGVGEGRFALVSCSTEMD